MLIIVLIFKGQIQVNYSLISVIIVHLTKLYTVKVCNFTTIIFSLILRNFVIERLAIKVYFFMSALTLSQIVSYFSNKHHLHSKNRYILPQTVFFGFFNMSSNNLLLERHIILLFKIYLYNSRKQKRVTLRKLICIIIKVKNIEKEINKSSHPLHTFG